MNMYKKFYHIRQFVSSTYGKKHLKKQNMLFTLNKRGLAICKASKIIYAHSSSVSEVMVIKFSAL